MSRTYDISAPPISCDTSDAPSEVRSVSRKAWRSHTGSLPNEVVSIAVIDDSRFQLAHICDILGVIKDCSVATFEKADQNVLEALVVGIDLIVIDNVMPGISGIDFVKQIRARAEFNATPIIMLTSTTDQATIKEALEAGVSQFQSKPISSVEFRCKVKSLLNYKRARRNKARRSLVMPAVETNR